MVISGQLKKVFLVVGWERQVEGMSWHRKIFKSEGSEKTNIS